MGECEKRNAGVCIHENPGLRLTLHRDLGLDLDSVGMHKQETNRLTHLLYCAFFAASYTFTMQFSLTQNKDRHLLCFA